jgi:S-adenosylmethionine synthetase
MDLSRAIVENKYTDAAHVFIVSQIGKPINEPQLLHFKLKNRVASKEQFEALAKEKLSGLHTYWRRIINVYTTIPKQGT